MGIRALIGCWADDDGSNCIHRGRQAGSGKPTSQQPASQAEEERGERAIEFTICCDIFTIMGRRLHYIKYNKIRHKNNGVSRFKSIHSRLSC